MLRRIKRAAYQRLAIGQNVHVGRGFQVGPGSHLWAPTRLAIADHVYVGKWCTIEVDGHIGSGTLIANNVGIVGRRDHDMRQIGVAVRAARWVGDTDAEDLRSSVQIGPDVWIGYGVTVLAPVTIGRGAILAAGAVVVNDVAPYSIVAGNPASVIGQRFNNADVLRHEAMMDAGT